MPSRAFVIGSECLDVPASSCSRFALFAAADFLVLEVAWWQRVANVFWPVILRLQVQQVLFPLLQHALNPDRPEAETLTEDALRLQLASLSGMTQITPQFQVMLPRVCSHLEFGS